MDVVIRVDASLHIGSGHVMRCLTLANALSKKRVNVSFICRSFFGNLIEYIKDSGFQVYVLEGGEQNLADDFDGSPELAHSSWLGVSQIDDANECKIILDKINPEWLVVDHYAIDFRWHKLLSNYYQKLMVIDDLADRKHSCDLLLDQTYGRELKDYVKHVSSKCKLLLGSEFSLLRSEFSQWRGVALQRRKSCSGVNQLLISMGGVDYDNVTAKVLEEVSKCQLSEYLKITVIMGKSAPHLQEVNKLAELMQYETEVNVSADNMAEIMSNADLAIGAAGATTWERCCLGLPTIMLVLAENQIFIANEIKKAGVAMLSDINKPGDICNKLLTPVEELQRISLKASEVTDGTGVSLTVEQML
jgi:UDP-2,4-diacetamido-2,4,6-trideoxy-beta-L-altropyranose hydrolase